MNNGRAVDVLDMNYRSARNLRHAIVLADRAGDRRLMAESVSELIGVLEDTSDIVAHGLKDISENPSRIPPVPNAAKDLIDMLRLAVMIDGVAIELLLSDKPGLDAADYRRLLASARKLIRSLSMRARSTRALIKKRWPDLWTEQLELEFQNILKMKV